MTWKIIGEDLGLFYRKIKEFGCKEWFQRSCLEPFNIDLELQKPEFPRFGTYTEITKDCRFLQISGYMLVPWYNILLRK